MIARLVAVAVFLAGMLSVVPALAQGGYYDDRGRDDSIQCESRDYRFTRCRTDDWRDARLVRQTSGSQCIRGRTWGVDRSGLWVDAGCSGVFVEARGGNDRPGYGGGWRPGADWDQDIRFRCASEDYNYNMCQVDVGRGGSVYISRQISNTACIEGRNWGFNRAGVWVDGGCEAEFVVERRWR